jgi:lysophospholipase L1-like esterase
MKKWYFIICFLIFCLSAFAQTPRFKKDIDAFFKADSLQFPSKEQILFVGSSSFTYWKDIKDYFPGYPILNRGFGGSALPDLIHYANQIIIPYQPKQIIIYCGENDMADSAAVTPKMVRDRFKTLFKIIRAELGNIPVVFVSIKPSPSRWKLEQKFLKANRLIKRYLKRDAAATYVNIHNAMLLPDGSVNPELFIQDNLHMNAKGYAIWQNIIEPILIK